LTAPHPPQNLKPNSLLAQEEPTLVAINTAATSGYKKYPKADSARGQTIHGICWIQTPVDSRNSGF